MNKALYQPNWFRGIYDYNRTKEAGASDLYALGGRPWIACCSIYKHGKCIFNFHKTFQSEEEARQYARKWCFTSFDRSGAN